MQWKIPFLLLVLLTPLLSTCSIGDLIILQTQATIVVAQTQLEQTQVMLDVDYSTIPQSRTMDGGFVLGNLDAPVTLIVFIDFSCPSCQGYKPTTDEFIDRFVSTGQAKYEVRILKTSGGETTGYASQLAECAEQQRPGAFWEAYEVLFDFGATGQYTPNMARSFAQRINLDLAELLSCVPSATQINKDLEFAQQYGVNSTPTVLIRYTEGDQIARLPGSQRIDDLAKLVEEAN